MRLISEALGDQVRLIGKTLKQIGEALGLIIWFIGVILWTGFLVVGGLYLLRELVRFLLS